MMNNIKRFFKVHQYILYLLPWLIGLTAFKLYPMATSLYYSFTDFSFFGNISTYGLMNYRTALSEPRVISSMLTTLLYASITVPLKLAVSLFFAALLNTRLRGIAGFRLACYAPAIFGGSVAVSILWRAIFRSEGILNTLLESLNIGTFDWLGSTQTALGTISLLRIWQLGSPMLIFLAALANVPQSLYEAAKLDGAGKITVLRKITLPMLSPVVFFVAVTQISEALQEFNGPFIVTQGGPRGSTNLISLLIYSSAFKSREVGFACALAWLLFAFIGGLTIAIFVSQKYWVYYNDSK